MTVDKRLMTVHSRALTWCNEKATLNMFIDNTKIIHSERVKAERKYTKILLASVSHEFRTPLNSMQANVMALLADKDKTKQQKKKYNIILQNIKL